MSVPTDNKIPDKGYNKTSKYEKLETENENP